MGDVEDPFRSASLTAGVVQALEHLSSVNRSSPIDTRELLAALVDVDAASSWSRVTLYSGDPHVSGIQIDPEPEAGGESTGRMLTRSLVRSVRIAEAIAAHYGVPVTPAVLALALASREDNAAAQALLSGSELSHHDLLGLIVSDVLGTDLDDFHTVLREARDSTGFDSKTLSTRNQPIEAVDAEVQPGRVDVDLLFAASELSEQLRSQFSLLGLPLAASDLAQQHEDLVADQESEVNSVALSLFGSDFGTLELAIAACVTASPRLTAVLQDYGVDPPEAAIRLSRIRPDAVASNSGASSSFSAALALGAGVCGLSAAFIAIYQVIDQHAWLKIPLLLIFLSGYPATPFLLRMALWILCVFAFPPGSAFLFGLWILLDLIHVHLERLQSWSHTGAPLTLEHQRRERLRQLASTKRSVAVLKRQQALRSLSLKVRGS